MMKKLIKMSLICEHMDVEEMIEIQEPILVEYFCYRKYLADFYGHKKQVNSLYSYRVFTARAGLKSSGHMKMVIDGKRNIGEKTFPMYLKGLGLNSKKEQRFFQLLVEYDQCQDLEKKIRIFEKILKEKKAQKPSTLQIHQYELLSQAYIVTIYVLIGITPFKMTKDNIQGLLYEKITKHKIEKALRLLVEIDLVKVEDGFYKQTGGAVTAPDEIKAIAVNQYHESMLMQSHESLKRDPIEKRNFNGVTVSINERKYQLICEKMNNFRKEINELIGDDDDATQVYQLSLNLFPLTRELE